MDDQKFEFDEIADQVFAPIYPVIARQIVEKTGKHRGKCLDVGSGGGHLGLSLAKITGMDVVLFDVLPAALEIAEKRILDWNLSGRVKTLLGDVHHIPAQDNEYDLVISRGSMWFWEDQKKGLQEIYRVLAPGGKTYVGGGFGNGELKDKINQEMRRRDPEWENFKKKINQGNDPQRFICLIQEAQIGHFDVIDDDKGFWLVLHKPEPTR